VKISGPFEPTLVAQQFDDERTTFGVDPLRVDARDGKRWTCR
jgi:hypothetical protein